MKLLLKIKTQILVTKAKQHVLYLVVLKVGKAKKIK